MTHKRQHNMPPPSPLLRPPPRTAAAFTLIELLTVIAIIGILAAILIPTVGQVRKSARMSASLSNIKQIGQALLLYANDNRQNFPYLSAPGGGSVIWSETVEAHMGWVRPQRTPNGPYNDPSNKPFNQSAVFMDPLVPRGLNHLYGDYGANELLMVRATSGDSIETLSGVRVSLASLGSPSRIITVMAAEDGSAAEPFPSTWRLYASQLATGGIDGGGGGKAARPSDRGTGKYLAVFADGHARWMRPEEFDAENKRKLLFNKP